MQKRQQNTVQKYDVIHWE